MPVRKIHPDDLHRVSSVCLDAFMEAVAPTLQEEGINTFRSIASTDGLASRLEADNEMLVYEDNHKITGFLELQEGLHIAMLFVSPGSQRKGVGRSLIAEALAYARSDVITVSASLTSVSAYLQYGFEYAGVASESAGLKYQPMEMNVNKSKHTNL